MAKTVTLIYTGPLASGEVRSDFDDTVYPFTRGGTVTVPEWLAHGHPGEPGVYEDDEGRHEFTTTADIPAGAVIIEDRIPPLGGLLDQPDNWTTAPKPKTKAAEAEPEDGAQ